MAEESLVGQIALMDKATDFTPKDRNDLESMAAFLAPALRIYSEKEFTRKTLDLNLKRRSEERRVG